MSKTRLTESHPNLIIKQWDFIKNNRLPQTYLSKSNKKVWWICPKNHSYQQVIANKTVKKHGCPCCSGHKVCNENCLNTTYPQISKEWN